MIGNQKEDVEGVCTALFYVLEKAQHPLRIDKQQFWSEKAKSLLGFKPGLLGQNAMALPLALPPLHLMQSFVEKKG